MTGREHTPLRALAAYAAAIRFLRGKTYIGDLPNKDGANGEHDRMHVVHLQCRAQVNVASERRSLTTVSHEWRRVPGRGRVFANDDRSEIVAAVFAGDWTNDEFSGEMRPETPPGPMWSW